MARLASIAKAGYYPAPPDIVALMARLLFPAAKDVYSSDRHVLIDPCCGTGEALKVLRDTWWPADKFPRSTWNSEYALYGAELEKGRYKACEKTLGGNDSGEIVHCDAFMLDLAGSRSMAGKATILYLNPPYDSDKEFGRLEERWLQRFSTVLQPGGALLFLIPGYALESSIATLATQYEDVRAFRLDDTRYAVWKQVIVVARKRANPLPMEDHSVRVALSVPPLSLPILSEATVDSIQPLGVQRVARYGQEEWVAAKVDLTGLLAKVKPWHTLKQGGRGVLVPSERVEPAEHFADVCLRTYTLAVPPRASHIAAGIAAGVFNGVRITSTTPGFPALYIKGVFTREFETIDTRFDKHGKAVSETQVQRPKLNITILDTSVSPPTYRTLVSDTAVTEATKIDDAFTIGDLLHHYGESLLSVLQTRCQPIYSYSEPLQQFHSPRELFTAQSRATAASLRLLDGPDHAVFLLGEIGVGKTSIALISAIEHGAKRILVVLPPHLVPVWRDEQIPEIAPGAIVKVLDTPSDVEELAGMDTNRLVVGLLSREHAKLGHSYSGHTTCPKCGTDHSELRKPEDCVRLRLRCNFTPTAPANDAARLAVTMAPTLAGARPDDPMIAMMSPRAVAKWMKRVGNGGPKATRPISKACLTTNIAQIAHWLAHDIYAEDSALDESSYKTANQVLAGLVWAADSAEVTEAVLNTLVDRAIQVKAIDALEAKSWRCRLLGLVYSLLMLIQCQSGETSQAAQAKRKKTKVSAQTAAWKLAQRLHGGTEATPYRPWNRYSYSGANAQSLRLDYEKHAAAIDDGSWLETTPLSKSDYDTFLSGLDFDPVMGFPTFCALRPGDPSATLTAFSRLLNLAQWKRGKECGEFLYCGIPQPRRYPLARYIVRRFPKLFDHLIADEAHEYANQDSAQSQAVQQLYGLKLPTIIMTGSVTTGYASSLFVPLWYLSAAFREEFKRSDEDRYIKRYGYVKRVIDLATGQVKEHGAVSSRKEVVRTVGQAPGVMPELVLRHLLPLAVTIHLDDLEGESIAGGTIKLPKCEEIVIRVDMLPEQLAAYTRLKDALVTAIRADRFTERQGRLFGQLAELPSMPDRFSADTGSDGGPDIPGDGTYTIRYPENTPGCGAMKVASVKCLPADTLLPKERALLDICTARKAAGRKVMVFPWHISLMPRLARILRAHGFKVAELYSDKVNPKDRLGWIDTNVLGKAPPVPPAGKRKRKVPEPVEPVDVLLVNPVAVQTGLNNLVYFSTVVWYENPACNPIVRRQARGRVKRIGQLLDVESITLIYAATLQEQTHTLLLHKVGIAEAVDGLDPTSALQAAGVGDSGAQLSQSIGKILWKMISTGQATS